MRRARVTDSRAPRQPSFGVWGLLALALALITLAAALVAFAGLTAPSRSLAARLPLAPADERRAADALVERTPGALEAASRDTRRALSQSPASASAWVRLAWIEATRDGGLTPRARLYLDRSYQVSPLGPDVSLVRLRLIFEHWGQAPSPLRRQALAELETSSRRRGANVIRLADELRDPVGRLALRMALAEIHLERQAADRARSLARKGNPHGG